MAKKHTSLMEGKLEDAVPAAEKANARAMVRDAIAGPILKGQKVFVRINSIGSGLMEEDLGAVITPGIDGINIPKSNSADDIKKVEAIIERLEMERGIEKGHIKLTPWVENARGLINAFEIASASPRIVGIIFGAEEGSGLSPLGQLVPNEVARSGRGVQLNALTIS